MNTGLSSHVFPPLWGRELNGAGDEEVFETKASPPAVAGPLISDSLTAESLTTEFRPPAPWFANLHGEGRPVARPCGRLP
jgi:hypothetical protein